MAAFLVVNIDGDLYIIGCSVVERAHFVKPNDAIGFEHFLLRVLIGVCNFCVLGINQFEITSKPLICVISPSYDVTMTRLLRTGLPKY